MFPFFLDTEYPQDTTDKADRANSEREAKEIRSITRSLCPFPGGCVAIKRVTQATRDEWRRVQVGVRGDARRSQRDGALR
ncbi:hypothetical protein E2C01_091950 [Portunus trituberculatus]|uniref:Uncharacterized protein n=1 Tax=Portunus trituberculatus TaxID=210409 RepID=A0A5B7JU82_PORTR|nr:hypothetical protein [Portunus trituberculatus]